MAGFEDALRRAFRESESKLASEERSQHDGTSAEAGSDSASPPLEDSFSGLDRSLA
jgi:hypothetical protein